MNPVEGTAVFFAACSCALALGILMYLPFFFAIRAYQKRHGKKASARMARRVLHQSAWSLRMVRNGFNEGRNR